VDLLSNLSQGNRHARRSTRPRLPADTAAMTARLQPIALCAGAFLLILFLACGWTLPGSGNNVLLALQTMLIEGGIAALWWIGAAGIGLGAIRLAGADDGAARAGAGPLRTSLDDLALAIASGAALMLCVASALGSLGLLPALGALPSWILIGAGLFLFLRTIREKPLALDAAPDPRWQTLFGPAAIGALAALFVAAAASAPGWLWSSEFAGFDALSYHLELPKEWILADRPVGPVEGNVYSALPSFVEAAFMQLMLMRGEIAEGALACQFWALIAAFASAFTVARLARLVVGDESGLVALVVFLSLPWVLVVGTLAYNDIVPCLMLAAAWFAIERRVASGQALDVRLAALLALLAAVAVGAKPTALLFVALPLLGITIVRAGPRALRLAPLVVGVAVVVLSPWLVRNQLAYGNALFPFAHALLGNGPWTDEQFAIFAKGHGPDRPFLERPPLIWSQWLAHGTGAAPGPREPWFPQWGLLPLAGLAGLTISARRDPTARAALLAIIIALAGWLAATHLKSRFLLPTAVPLTVGAAMLLASAARRTQPAVVPLILAPSVALAFVAYWREPARPQPQTSPDSTVVLQRAPAAMIGGIPFKTGELFAQEIVRLPPEQQAEFLPVAPLEYFLNFAIDPNARILGVGFSTPFYSMRRIEWNTVWDRGVLDRVAGESPDAPETWAAQLKALGFSHVVVQPIMLDVWQQSGWLNPALAPDRWLRRFLDASKARVRTPDGSILVEL
jgi:hypothetical protein